jgi:hypothetical protein
MGKNVPMRHKILLQMSDVWYIWGKNAYIMKSRGFVGSALSKRFPKIIYTKTPKAPFKVEYNIAILIM